MATTTRSEKKTRERKGKKIGKLWPCVHRSSKSPMNGKLHPIHIHTLPSITAFTIYQIVAEMEKWMNKRAGRAIKIEKRREGN